MSDAGMIRLFNMSLTGGAVILLVMILRLLLKKMPKRYFCALWLVPFLRLLLPISIPSPLSLLPVNPQPILAAGAVPVLQTGVPLLDIPVSLILAQTMEPAPLASANPAQIYLFLAKIVWAAGLAVFLAVNLFRYFRLKLRLADAVPGEAGVRYSDRLSMPMVVGIVKPKIYLPSMFLKEENSGEKEYILAHEQAHKSRGDHLTKLLAFAALAVHWFNPLVWAAFLLLCRDMEMACDERVIEQLSEEKRKGYSLALLHFEERRSALLIPLAFGESHTKSRIKNILNYRKPAFWVSVAAVVLIVFAALTLLTDPNEAASGAVIGGTIDGSTVFGVSGNGNAASIGIIGGADGPTSIFLAGKIGGDDGAAQAETLDLEQAKREPYGTEVELDYVSAGKISMHGYFGYLVFTLSDSHDGASANLERAVTLSEAGPIFMQGDSYTEIIGGDGGAMIFPGIYSPEDGEGSAYVYTESENTITDLADLYPEGQTASEEETGTSSFSDFMKDLRESAADGHLADAPIEQEYQQEAAELIFGQYGSELLYGPVVVPEVDSNIYGFLAADGGNLEDVWYGLWNRDLGTITRIDLFP